VIHWELAVVAGPVSFLRDDILLTDHLRGMEALDTGNQVPVATLAQRFSGEPANRIPHSVPPESRAAARTVQGRTVL